MNRTVISILIGCFISIFSLGYASFINDISTKLISVLSEKYPFPEYRVSVLVAPQSGTIPQYDSISIDTQKTSFLGTNVYAINLIKQNQLISTKRIPITIQINHNVAIAATMIPANQAITEGMVTMSYLPMHILPPDTLTSSRTIIGQQTSSPIKLGAFFLEWMFKKELLIPNQKKIKLIVISGKVRLETTGIALINGYRGCKIKVREISNQKIVEGIVKDADTVIMELQ